MSRPILPSRCPCLFGRDMECWKCQFCNSLNEPCFSHFTGYLPVIEVIHFKRSSSNLSLLKNSFFLLGHLENFCLIKTLKKKCSINAASEENGKIFTLVKNRKKVTWSHIFKKSKTQVNTLHYRPRPDSILEHECVCSRNWTQSFLSFSFTFSTHLWMS